jgi:hypothetical protein
LFRKQCKMTTRLCTCTLLSLLIAVYADDIETVRLRMLSTYGWGSNTSLGINSTVMQALSFAESLNSSGMWSDINYNDYNDRTIWATAVHMNRVSTMSAALSIPSSPVYNLDPLFNKTRLALNAWYLGDWKNSNWWWDILEMPQIHSISFLMLDVLPKNTNRAFPSPYELDRATNFSLRATWWNASLGYEVTAANLAWMVQAQLLRGVWPSQVNVTALTQGFSRMWEEVKIVDWDPTNQNGTNQGIQVDFSFHMHSAQIQTAQYGQDYLQDELSFIEIAAGTSFAIDNDRVQILCSYLENMAWQSTGMGFDWALSGRAMDRNSWSAVSKVNVPTTAMRMLATSYCNSNSTVKNIIDFSYRVDNYPTAAKLVGHRHFWTSDYSTHKRSNWTAGWHGTSRRTVPNECGNGENLLGMYEAQGLLNIMNNHCELSPESSGVINEGPIGWGCGQEYVGIFPLLDWTALNGATALVDLPMPPCGPAQCCWHPGVSAGNKSFVGGVSDGTFGASVMDTSYLTLTAKKSTFFFDNVIISMGTDISESSGNTRVRTALASRFLKKVSPGLSLGFTNGSVITVTTNSSFSIPSGPPDGSNAALSFAYADFVGWLPALPINGNQNVAIYPQVDGFVGYKNEPWNKIGVFPGNVSGRTLSLTIQHDNVPPPPTPDSHYQSSPLIGASFAYAVLPDTTFNEMKIATNDLFSITGVDTDGLMNSNVVQAAVQVSSTQAVLQAVFWQTNGGSFTYNNFNKKWNQGENVTLTVDHASLLVVEIDATSGNVTIGASNPDTSDLNLTVSIAINGKASLSCSDVVFQLNPASSPNYLGESLVKGCNLT